MALTRDFKVIVRERLQRDPAFRKALLAEAVDCLLSSDVETDLIHPFGTSLVSERFAVEKFLALAT